MSAHFLLKGRPMENKSLSEDSLEDESLIKKSSANLTEILHFTLGMAFSWDWVLKACQIKGIHHYCTAISVLFSHHCFPTFQYLSQPPCA